MLSSSFPSFAGPIENITVNVGREAILECHVNHLGKYKVGWLKARDQTILALHHRVVTHNGRIDVDHDNNRYGYRAQKLLLNFVNISVAFDILEFGN